MSKGVDYPDPINPFVSAGAQGALNLGSSLLTNNLNKVNTANPWGETTWTGSGLGALLGLPQTQTTSYSPEMMDYFNTQLGAATTMMGLGAQRAENYPDEFTYAGLPTLGDYDTAGQRIEDATFDRYMRMLEPQWERDQQRLQTDLSMRGLPIGQEAYGDATSQFQTDMDRARLQAADAAVLAGSNEQNRLFMQDLAARQQLGGEQMAERSQQMAELASLFGMSPYGSAPSPYSLPAQNLAAPNAASAINANYQGQIGQAQAQQAANAALSSSLAGLGGSWLLAGMPLPSHPAFKEHNKPAGDLLGGVERLNVERWRYKPETMLGTAEHIGPYADEFREVFGVGDGVTINVVDALGVCLGAIKQLAQRVEELEHE